MIEISRALKIIEQKTPWLGSERVALTDSVGRVLVENVVADSDLPPFDRSQMDGYAVVASDTKNSPVTLKIVGESAAGRGWHNTMKTGEAVRIMTGASVPAGADAVQKVELTSGWSDDRRETVTILEAVKKGTAIVRKGAEVTKDKLIFSLGEVATEQIIAALASFGYAKVRVGKAPRVAIMSTGTEIVPVNKKPDRDQIRNSNSVMLEVLCRKFACSTTILPMVGDDLAGLKVAIRGARCEILIITGGVSVGKYDLTKQALADLGAEIFFDKVRLKPGKPAVFARLGKTLIFGLPGNPVSAAVTFQLFVRKAIMLMQRAAATDLSRGNAILTADAKAPVDRDAYVPSALSTDQDGHLLAAPLRSQGSSDFIAFSRADSLIVLKRGARKAKGDVADILFL
ncbi:MAG TPA: gephyrin-like molybdotransferase Glp [Pyrinomonadaceae bacterium]|jgi:molybdenum cofactor synthesis domain-containing protein|nr:gephyrin-like molybdotransferase Glp [Pyrinomonadaceae bacterium]